MSRWTLLLFAILSVGATACVEDDPIQADPNTTPAQNNGEQPENNGEQPENNGEEPQNNSEEPQNNGEEPQNNGEEPQNNGEAPENNGEAPDPEPDPDPEPEPEPDPEPEPTPEPCPEGVICVDSLPATLRGDTRRSDQRALDGYGCAPEVRESGAEVVYRVEVAQAGFLALDLIDVEDGADVDIHLLYAPSASQCVDRGHWRAGAMVEPGTFWVVADTWTQDDGQELPGAYTLRVNLTTADDLVAHGMSPALAHDALFAFSQGWERGHTRRLEYIVSDFSLHSSHRRQWVVDLSSGALLWNLHVAHGRGSILGSDEGVAGIFSNIPESHQSSLGVMVSAEPYTGDYGISFQIDGLEEGFNDLVRRRDIVMHPWEGSRPAYVARTGVTQPTWGCPAIDPAEAAAYVERLSGGALMLFWHPESAWHQESTWLP